MNLENSTFFSLDSHKLSLVGGGALGALAFLLAMKYAHPLKPAMAGILKEAYGFKEWLLGNVESFTADVEDAAAEAKHAYQQEQELEKHLDLLLKDKALLEKIIKMLQEKAAKTKSQ